MHHQPGLYPYLRITIVNRRLMCTYFITATITTLKLSVIFDRSISNSYSCFVLDLAHSPTNNKESLNMGYLVSWNANKVIDLEQQDAPTAEQIEELQLTETEQAELEAV